jgi:hypothetical protein
MGRTGYYGAGNWAGGQVGCEYGGMHVASLAVLRSGEGGGASAAVSLRVVAYETKSTKNLLNIFYVYLDRF